MKRHDRALRYEVRLYGDEDCAGFLRRHVGEAAAQTFSDLQYGAHKSDLCRYALLYESGGVYFDLDATLAMPLAALLTRPGTFYAGGVCVEELTCRTGLKWKGVGVGRLRNHDHG